MTMFASIDENPAMTLRVIKETKRYGRTDARTAARTDNVKTVYPPQTIILIGIFYNNIPVSYHIGIFTTKRYEVCLSITY